MVREYWTLLPVRYYMRFVMVNLLLNEKEFQLKCV